MVQLRRQRWWGLLPLRLCVRGKLHSKWSEQCWKRSTKPGCRGQSLRLELRCACCHCRSSHGLALRDAEPKRDDLINVAIPEHFVDTEAQEPWYTSISHVHLHEECSLGNGLSCASFRLLVRACELHAPEACLFSGLLVLSAFWLQLSARDAGE